MPKVIFQDNTEDNFAEGTALFDVFKPRFKDALKNAVAVKVNGKLVDLRGALAGYGDIVRAELISLDSKEGIEVCRHSAAHVMAEAVRAIYPSAKCGIGPTIEDGFYYDFDVEKPFTPEDIAKIEAKMGEIISGGHAFTRTAVSKEAALETFGSAGEKYKVELINALNDGEITLYTQSGFTDLCRGPHLPSTRFIKAYKITGFAGAYWRGDEKNKMLQRIYGVAFASKKELEDYLHRLEEAKRRDHRKLGKELDLFSTNEAIGSGLVLWHPAGSTVRRVIEDFWKKEHAKGGYDIVYTPHVAMLDLWKTSGHWDFYRDNLYSPMDVEGQDYIVKPMNCPFHIQIYKSHLRSYRDLPIRYAELGTVYRYERSGALHGLLRVRGFTQDDAHIFMRPDQLEEEIKSVLHFTLYILRSFGFNEFDVYLSTRPEKYVGTLPNWEKAEAALKSALESTGLKYSIDPGEGVFYGPKIDVKIKDIIGRSWQCSTVQVDFNLPERFDVSYRDEHGAEARPIMLHRALMGSLERFFGCLVEHYAGAFPFWLAPVQAVLLTVTDRNNAYAGLSLKKLKAAGIRAELDDRNEKLGFKIREAELRKIPYMLVAGDKEEADGMVSPRAKDREVKLESMTIEEFIAFVAKEGEPEGGEIL